MRKYPVLLIILCLLITSGITQEVKYSFDEKMAWDYIKALADDDMQGRKSGQPGGAMGEDYIAARFKEWGVEAAGDGGTYFQNFTIAHRNIGGGAVFEVLTERQKRSYDYGDDWRVQRYSGAGGFMAEIVFVGYGIHAPEKGYDDYADVNVKGKLVLLTNGVPTKLAAKLEEEAAMPKRITAAQEKGALGIVGFPWGDSQSPYFYMASTQENYHPDFVLMSVEEHVLDFIFKDLNTDLRPLFQTIDVKGTSQSFATGVRAHVGVHAEYDPKRETRNVLAKITGSDPRLKNEYVVIGAHMDHLGINPLGEVYNGANDNASGTAVVMEIARNMQRDAVKPKRTVIFGLWAGEEQGLLGSYHYCDEPTHPIEKTVMYINMDMVAHGSGAVNFRGEFYAPKVWETIKSNLPEEILEYTRGGRGGPGGSDHTPFLMKGVPAFSVNTQGTHLKYHRTRDDSDLVKPELLKKTGDLVYAATLIMANQPGDFIKPGREALFHFKYQTLVNHKLNSLEHVFEAHRKARNTHVDVQLAYLEEKEGLIGEALRADLVDRLFSMRDEFRKAGGMVSYDAPLRYSRAERAGQTTVVVGLKGVGALIDDPRWAEVLFPLGARFVALEDPGILFKGGAVLSEKGAALVKALNSSGMLLMVKTEDAALAKALFEATKKPLVLLTSAAPGQEILDLVKETNSLVGLLLPADADIPDYFQSLHSLKEAAGSSLVFAANTKCLWGAGKDQVMGLVTELVEAEYGRGDFRSILSGNVLSLLDRAGRDN
jgi:hypothetical protein